MEQKVPPVKEINARIRAKHAPVSRGALPDSAFKVHVPSDEDIQRMISLVVETITARFKNLEAMPFELFDAAGGSESNLFSNMEDVAAGLPDLAGVVGNIIHTGYPWDQIRDDGFTYECVGVGFQLGLFAGVYQATHSADALRDLGEKFFRTIKAQPRFHRSNPTLRR